MAKRWVVVFDFNGTLTHKSTVSLFKLIDMSGGLTPEVQVRAQAMREKYLSKLSSGFLTRAEERQWFHETMELYIESKLTTDTIQKILSPIKLRDGAVDCLKFLKQKEIPAAIVSYGIVQFITPVLRANNALEFIDKIYSVNLIVHNGVVQGYEPETAVLPYNKGYFSRAFADLHRVKHENILAVGDSRGDVNLGYLKENRFGIAKDEKEKSDLEQFMDTVTITETFYPITQWLAQKISDGEMS